MTLNKRNKKKVLSLSLSLTLVFSFSYTLLFTDTVKADEITDVVITVSPINAMFRFNTTASETYINISENGDDNYFHTYIDPTDLMSNCNAYPTGNNQRWMFVRGLNDSTTYNYTIVIDDVNDATGQFTTTLRYTNSTGWGDEFLDDYLWDNSNNIDIYQSDGVKYSGNPISDKGVFVPNMVSWKYINDTYYVFAGDQMDSYDWNFNTNGTGLNFSAGWTLMHAGQQEWYVVWDEEESLWVSYVEYTPTGGDYRIYTATLGHETDISFDLEMTTQFPSIEPHGFCYDTLGVNNFIIGNIYHSTPRKCVLFYGMPNGSNYDKWWVLKHDKQMRTPGSDALELDIGSDGSYGMYPVIRNQMYIGFIRALENNAGDGQMYGYLIYSRNGYNWIVLDNTKHIIPVGSPGAWDDEVAEPTNNPLFIVGDYDRLYYEGVDQHHGEAWTHNALGIINFRKYGLSYIKPTSTPAWLRTVAIPNWFTKNFTVNGNFTATAKLNISILNPSTDTPYPGFSFSDFNTITTNSTSISPTWGSKTLEDLPSGTATFKINFSWDGMGSGELYSYTLDGFGDPQEELIQFISINDGNNGTVFQGTTHTFNGTTPENTSTIWLQVSDTYGNWSSSHLVVNLSNISESEFPSHFTIINSTHWSFTLPEAYAITPIKWFYCRFETYTLA